MKEGEAGGKPQLEYEFKLKHTLHVHVCLYKPTSHMIMATSLAKIALRLNTFSGTT